MDVEGFSAFSDITFTSEVTGTEHVMREPELVRISVNRDYFMAVIDFSGFEDGEYVYSINGEIENPYTGVHEVSLTGLIHIGVIKTIENEVQYNSNHVSIQYHTDL